MNGSPGMASEFLPLLSESVILCVPFVMLGGGLSAQDCSAHKSGAYTGEVSAEMIAKAGAKYCIVGHSERRRYHNETDEIVLQKAMRCIENNITPIVCVENAGQVAGFKNIPPASFILAYEPVSAIGTGLVPSAADIEKVHTEISEIVPNVSVLYGGSVNPENAQEILDIKNVGGLLIGGASLDIEKFKKIIAVGHGSDVINEVVPDSRPTAHDLNDKYLRAVAELDNLRKRTAVDIENAARNRAMVISNAFLPLVDAIDAATGHSPDDDGISALKKAADNVLGKIGIVKIETVGQMLNPQFHNAISTEESDMPTNSIVREMQSGFMFGDSVLRTAMVVVSKGKDDETAHI